MTTSSDPAGGGIRPDRLLTRELGPLSIVALVVAYAVLWFAVRPAGEDTGGFSGQLIGAEAVVLLSLGLILVSTLPWVEHWFDGMDRAAIWHRRMAITGMLLLIPHVMLAGGNPDGRREGGGDGMWANIATVGLITLAAWSILPRWRALVPRRLRPFIARGRDLPGVRTLFRRLGGYTRWRSVHRLTGLFVAAAFVHGLLDGSAFDGSAVLRWTYVAIAGIGLAFYVWRETLARRGHHLHDYQVAAVRPLSADLTEIALTPVGQPMHFTPGQFAMVFIEGKDGWHRHPFSIASGTAERDLRVAVKALGDYTSTLREEVQPGMPAVIGGPYGRFHHRKGTSRQVWLAGGVGIAPFLAWLRSLGADAPARVDLFHSNEGESPFWDEMREIAAAHPGLRVHLVDTTLRPFLDIEEVLAAAGDTRGLSAFMCGPPTMLRAFQKGLRRAGVRGRDIHREHFDWR